VIHSQLVMGSTKEYAGQSSKAIHNTQYTVYSTHTQHTVHNTQYTLAQTIVIRRSVKRRLYGASSNDYYTIKLLLNYVMIFYGAVVDWYNSQYTFVRFIVSLCCIVTQIKDMRVQMFPMFENFDRVHVGSVTRNQFRRAIDTLDLARFVSTETEWNCLWDKFKTRVGGQHDVNYIDFCDEVYHRAGFTYRRP